MADTLEAVMLVLFGFSWPVSVVKSIKSRTAKSTSLPFIILIILGYIAGISAKIIQQKTNYVLIVYILNLTIVTVNLFVFFRNRRLDRLSQTKNEKREELKMPLFSTEICRGSAEKAKEFEMKNKLLKRGGVVFLGDDYLLKAAPEEFSAECDFGFPVYSRCISGLTIDDACRLAEEMVIPLNPSKLFICLNKGEKEDSGIFVAKYEWLLYSLSLKSSAEMFVVLAAECNADKETAAQIRCMAKDHGCPCIELADYGTDARKNALIFQQLKPYIRSGSMTFVDAMSR